MEKRALIAIALSFLILLIWTSMFPPPEQPAPLPEPSGVTDLPRTAEVEPYERERDDQAVEPGLPAEAPPVAAVAPEQINVSNGLFQVVLTNRGGRAVSWRLDHYTNGDDEPLDLIPRFTDDRHLPLGIELDDVALTEQLNDALFAVKRQPVDGPDGYGSGERIEFTWSDGRGLEARKSFTFFDQGWLVDVDLEVVDRGRRIPARLAVGPGFAAQEEHSGKSTYYYGTGSRRGAQGVWNLAGTVTRLKGKRLTSGDNGVSGRVLWAGLEDQYFTVLVLPSAEPAQARWRSLELTRVPSEGVEDEEIEAAREPILSVSVPESGARLFIGPKKYTLLQGLGNELEKSIWFATNSFLAAITKYIFFALLWIYDHIAGNYGLAIILATFFLRLLLFPVNQYSMVSMKKAQMQMQRLQPKIKAIKAKYKKVKDAQARAKMNQETMELYKREGVNPMGGVAGCLPLLAQFPILIGFYNMLTVAVELRGAPFFGWIYDLSQKDPFYVTPLLMAATMFLQQRMAMSKVKDPMQAQQQKMMMLMPFVFGWICMQMPAGMVLYWFVNNVLGIGQQWLVNRHTGRLEAAAQKA